MTISSLLGRSLDSAGLAVAITACVTVLPRTALREWEESLADAAIHACAERGGTALLGADHVVSCAPGALSSGRER
jgi:hypothetical protein